MISEVRRAWKTGKSKVISNHMIRNNLAFSAYLRKLAVKIYKLTAKFPPEEKFGLVSQMRRAVNSTSSNIAEGSSRESLKDQARYSEISFGSLKELLNDSILSLDLCFINESELKDLRVDIYSIGFKLDGLRKSQLIRYKTERIPKSK